MTERLATAHISLANYRHNLHEIRKIVGPEIKILAIVKANAYGHGIAEISRAAMESRADYLGVVSLGELRQLRAARVTAPVLIINYIDAGSVTEALELGATLTVFDPQIIHAVNSAASQLDTTAKLHINIDTGLHRDGCAPADSLSLAQLVHRLDNVQLEGVFTHFAESEDESSDYTTRQLQVFEHCLAQLDSANLRPPLVHTANSAAVIAHPSTHYNMVRPGIVTYGLTPFDPSHSQYDFVQKTFRPVLSLTSIVAHLRHLDAGQTVGYNRRWAAKRPSTLALVPIGYGDGWRRTPQPATHVLIDGQMAPIVGSISMDQLTVDVTDIPHVQTGDGVVLIGAQGGQAITASDLAAQQGTIHYEITTQLSARIQRSYK